MSITKIIIPSINSIRIRPISSIEYSAIIVNENIKIDYVNYFPKFDLMTMGEKYQKGIYPIKDLKRDLLVNKQFSFQFKVDIPTSPPYPLIEIKLFNNITGAITNLTYSNISPVGWVGYDVLKFSFTPTIAGVYYFTIRIFLYSISKEYTFKSDEFFVRDDATDQMDIVEVKYKHYENDFDFVFDDYYTTYFTGMVKLRLPEEEMSTFDEENFEVLNSKSTGQFDLILTELPRIYIPVVSQIFRCSDILVNGMECAKGGGIEENETEKSDIVDLIIKLKSTISNDIMNFI